MSAYLVRLTRRMSEAANCLMSARARRVIFTSALVAASGFGAYAQENNTPARGSQRYINEGLSVEFAAEPLETEKGVGANLLEGGRASVRFKITDAGTGSPVTGLHPSAWIDRREAGAADDAKHCGDKVRSFLQSNLSKRADVDLNAYFILALNQEPNISVIDPLSGFGASKLLMLVPLKSPGEDWLMSSDQRRLFVSMPLAGQVAVIDTATWRVTDNIDVKGRPARLRLQHDEAYLWAADDGADPSGGGVAVIDAASLKVVAQIPTGKGAHDIDFTNDDRYAFVTNRQDGTLSVIDVARLSKVKDIRAGALPSGVAFSPLSNAAYVVNEGDGTMAVVSARGLEVTARVTGKPGMQAVYLTPDGRLGFILNRAESLVHVFDTSNNRLLHTVRVGASPDQITFTKTFAYVRALGEEFVTMIRLSELDKGAVEASVTRFPGGQRAPQSSASRSRASSIIPTPEEGSVLVANPADQTIYYYAEGMAAPMGSFRNYRRDPRAVLVLDQSLRETSPGVYSATAQLARAGEYDVAFFLNSPRALHCFNISVKPNPAERPQGDVAIRIEPLAGDEALRVNESHRLRFRVTDGRSGEAKSGLADMVVMTVLNPGVWQEKSAARSLGDGLYEMSFVPPQAGAYYVFFQCPSLGVRPSQVPFLVLRATDGGDARPRAPGPP